MRDFFGDPPRLGPVRCQRAHEVDMLHVFPRLGILSALLLISAPSFAQLDEPARPPGEPRVHGSGPDYEVTFDDDALQALGADVLVPRITVRPRPERALLIRPRTSFVPEMLKSVEKM